MKICVFGSADVLSDRIMKDAAAIGKYIADYGHTLTYGGFGSGVLGAAARAAKAGGADITAIMPCTPRKNEFDKCTSIFRSDDKRERKKLQSDNADAFIVLPTGIGVMDELFEILILKSYGQHSKPILIYNADNSYKTLVKLLTEMNALKLCKICDSLSDIKDFLAADR